MFDKGLMLRCSCTT